VRRGALAVTGVGHRVVGRGGTTKLAGSHLIGTPLLSIEVVRPLAVFAHRQGPSWSVSSLKLDRDYGRSQLEREK
ncbi:hypothetical protein ABZ695_34900, partial [Streptomyces sp. NPDC006976]|uniref:hypothetical protein n=1 Tax=Streptomyces sp. NPDC006976 TaxID=3154311 RepID=UPI0033F9B7A3